MDTVFNDALDRAIEIGDEVILRFFEREKDRREKCRDAGRLGGRPKKPMVFQKKSSKRKYNNNYIFNSKSSSSYTTTKQIINKLNAEFVNITPNWFDNANSSIFAHKTELAELLAKYIPLAQVNGDMFCKCLQKWEYIARAQNKRAYLQKIFKEEN